MDELTGTNAADRERAMVLVFDSDHARIEKLVRDLSRSPDGIRVRICPDWDDARLLVEMQLGHKPVIVVSCHGSEEDVTEFWAGIDVPVDPGDIVVAHDGFRYRTGDIVLLIPIGVALPGI